MTDKQTILVIGGTGMLGEPVARKLLADGYNVRIFTRNEENARKQMGEGFSFSQGDMEKPDTIARAAEGCHGIHISAGCNPETPEPDRLEHQGPANVATVAFKAGVQRITLVSGSMLNPENLWNPLVKAKHAGEMAVKESGVPFCIFACTASMESLAMFVQGKRAMVPGKQDYLWHYFAAEDLARMVSLSYRLQDAANKHFYIHGPEAMTTVEALKYYCSEMCPDVKIGRMPLFMMKALGILTFNREIKFFAKLMTHIEMSPERGDPTEANEILGTPKITLSQWCESKKASL